MKKWMSILRSVQLSPEPVAIDGAGDGTDVILEGVQGGIDSVAGFLLEDARAGRLWPRGSTSWQVGAGEIPFSPQRW